MAQFKRSLGTLQAFVLSLAIIAPTLAMAFNVALAVQAAGRAAPLAFLIGGLSMAMIGLGFVAFGRRIADAGSAAAYVAAAFGPRPGFLAGWGLLLAYLCFLASANALVGGFLAVALSHAGIAFPGLWQAIAALAGLLVIRLGGREIARLTLIMLVIEAAAVLAILWLAAVILTQVPLSAAPFLPDPERGVAGLGYGMVFAVLSFAGFEGAATVAEETRDPHRAIPIAILGSLAAATLLYGLVSYAQVLGYGLEGGEGGAEGGLGGVRALGRAQAPLDALSTRFLSGGYAAFLDAAAGISSLACALGTASAAARVLYALARRGLLPRLAEIDPAHGGPARAARVAGILNLVALAAFGWGSVRAYSEAFATVATLVLILVYAAVALAQAREAGRRWPAAIGLVGAALMAWPFLNSLYPPPDWPGPLWPFVVLAWMAAGLVLARRLPAPARADVSAGGAAAEVGIEG